MDPVSFEFTGFNSELLAEIAKKTANALKGFEFTGFLVGCTFADYLSQEGKETLKKEFQPLLVKEIEKKIGKKADYENPEIQILINFNQDLVFFLVKPVYLYGRYKKYSRKLPQTKHYCFKCKGRGCNNCNNAGILSKESVEEIIARHAMPFFKASNAVFHGAGREDDDVRMLGNGREFVLEIIEPRKRSIEIKKIENAINKKEKEKIEVKLTGFCDKKKIAEIKEKKNEKIYSAKANCKKPVVEKELEKLIGKFEIKQKTPSRINKKTIEREKKAEILEAKTTKNPQIIELKIKASSGLYLKEFISGDEKRTAPSISELLKIPCKCVELDVIEILE